MIVPSGFHATASTELVAASPMTIGSPIGLRVAASNNRNVPSSLPLAMVVPAGFHATVLVFASPAIIASPIGCKVVASNKRTVPSPLPVAMIVPAGFHATANV